MARKPGSTFTRVVTRGPNKGDKVKFKVAPGGKAYPVSVLLDKGNNSTLKGTVRFGKKKKQRKKRKNN